MKCFIVVARCRGVLLGISKIEQLQQLLKFRKIDLEFEFQIVILLHLTYGWKCRWTYGPTYGPTHIKESKSLPIFKSQLKYLIFNEY